MKKRDLLFTGLILCSVSAFADGPTQYPDNAKVIFTQNFEGSSDWTEIRLNPDPKRPTTLFTWQTEPVDSIKQITYYKRNYDGTASDNPSGGTDIYAKDDKQWEVAGVRDTTMLLYSGVMRTDAEWPEDSILGYDQHLIKSHRENDGATQTGGTLGKDYGLDRFGENGGNQYFYYKSASSGSIGSNQVAPEYRRNLFVRLNPGDIEENSSYRVTVFVRGKSYATKSDAPKPQIGLDLMRGYFHSEKSFMVSDKKFKYMGTNWWGQPEEKEDYMTFNDKTSYQINAGEEAGKWQKVTLMAYYNTDRLGDASPYLLSYYWHDDWDWKTPINKTTGEVVAESADTATLKFIKQPDKYFVRLAFRSDSTEFEVDNLSLTKSWIGGVEHADDMLRVDFGYETNMGDLAEAAKVKNKIAAVELPGKYFDVWAQFEEDGELFWERMPILTAEYHGDGYMYMWTEEIQPGIPNTFDGAKQVLVTFRNPTDRNDLKLVYKGNHFPKGLDEAWINGGKLVQDFHNEISALNPTIKFSNGKAVKSLKHLPPVCQREAYVDGTFGLASDMTSMTFKFSKQLAFENTGDENTDVSFVKLEKAGTVEYWQFQQYASATDTNTVIVRPSNYTTPLSGDYVLTIDQITHLSDATTDNAENYGDDVVLNLHFGDFSLNPQIDTIRASDWRSEMADPNTNTGVVPTSLYIYDSSKPLVKGDGTRTGGANSRMYISASEGLDNCIYYLASRSGNADTYGKLYTLVDIPSAGKYTLSFKSVAWNNKYDTKVYVFPKPNDPNAPAGELQVGEAGLAVLNACETEQNLIATYKPDVTVNYSTYQNKSTGTWPANAEKFSFNFVASAAGPYVIEWQVTKTSTDGVGIGNFTVTTAGDLSVKYVNKVNASVAAAAAKIAEATAGANNRYKGADFNKLTSLKSSADNFITTKKASKVNKPSEYEAEAKALDDAVSALKVRMDTVDAFYKAIDSLQFKINEYSTADSLIPYKDFPEIAAAQTFKNGYNSYQCKDNTSKAIQAETDKIYAEMKKLDNRLSLALKFADAVSFASDMKDSADVKGIPTTELEAAITAAGTFDVVNITYDALRAEMQALTDLALATAYGDDIKALSVRRINELKALADNLGASYATVTPGAELDAILARIQNVDFDDDELADIIKAAINLKIYQKIAASQSVDSIDLTPYIKNYYLYATVKGYVDNSDLELPTARTNARAQALQGAAQIQKIAHQWGNSALDKKIWVMILEQEYTDLFPGWTAKSFVTGSHSMFTPDNANYTRLSKDTLVFDGQIGMDWNSKAEMKTVVTGLPAGIYSLSLDANGRNDTNNTRITLSANSEETKVTASKAGAIEVKADGLRIEEGTLDIDLTVEVANGGFDGDNFKLMYLGKIDSPFFEPYYATLLQNAQKTLDKLITVVDASEAVAGDVEFFTLGGVQLDAPIENQVILRKTTQNGNVVVEKVIYK